MIFDHDHLEISLLNVLELEQHDVHIPRNLFHYAALTLRVEADTEIRCRDEVLHLSDRSLCFFPGNIPYARHAAHDKMIVFHFNLANYTSYHIRKIETARYDELLPLFREALREWNEHAPGYYYRASALLYRIFALLYEEHKQTMPENDLEDLLEYIHDRYTDPSLTVAELAARAHVSETYLRLKFQRNFGVSPKRYLTDLRLERAKSLLNAGYDSVSSVARQCGFRDAKHFATVFRRSFGYPPSRQRYDYAE